MKIILFAHRLVNNILLIILQFKFTVFSIIFFFSDLSLAMFAVFIGFLLDKITMIIAIIYSNKNSFKNLLNDISVFYEDCTGFFETANISLIEDIESYYAKYNMIYKKKT